jgi:16S rRNA (guanine1207-N2)-methyltransferase
VRKRSRGMRRLATTDYHEFQTLEAVVGDRTFAFVSKPGIASWYTVDVDTQLLSDCVRLVPHQKVLCVGCRHGLLGAIIADRLPDVELWLLDSNVVAVRATQRTVALHGLSQAKALLSDALWEVRDQCFDQVLINLPKGKALVNQLILDAFRVLNTGGYFCLAGGNREGIKSRAKAVGRVFGNDRVALLGGRHRVISAVKQASEIPSQVVNDLSSGYYDYTEFDVSVRGQPYHIVSKPGVFSWDRLDAGTRVLLDHLEIGHDDTVLDLGTGCGIIGVVAATLAPRGHVYLVDAHIAAVNASQRTIDANNVTNATVRLSDLTSDVRDMNFDVVATNPPFHAGIETEHQVALQFITDAHTVLKAGGRFYLVANRFLKYEPFVTEEFGNCRTIYSDSRYKVLQARRGSQ